MAHDLAQFQEIKRQRAIDDALIFALAEGSLRQPSRRAKSVVVSTLGHIGADNDDYQTTATLHDLRHYIAALLAS